MERHGHLDFAPERLLQAALTIWLSTRHWRAANIPFAWLPHPALSPNLLEASSHVSFPGLSSLASHPWSERHGYIPWVDSGLRDKSPLTKSVGTGV